MAKRGKKAPKKDPAQKQKEQDYFVAAKVARLEDSGAGYRWEQHGSGITHHCGECQTPLTNPCARAKCIGKHMVVCEKFHNTMFRIGNENRCNSCLNTKEAQHEKRREIARLLKEVEVLDKSSVLGEVDPNAVDSTLPTSPAQKLTRREKKRERAAAKAAKIAKESTNNVTSEEIRRIAKVMQEKPNIASIPQLDGVEEPDADDEIQNTPIQMPGKRKPANTRFSHGRRFSIAKSHPVDESAEDMLKKLGVQKEVKGPARGRSELVKQLQEAVKENLVWTSTEREELEMRKKGFRKFAGRAAYDRVMNLVAENREKRGRVDMEGEVAEEEET